MSNKQNCCYLLLNEAKLQVNVRGASDIFFKQIVGRYRFVLSFHLSVNHVEVSGTAPQMKGTAISQRLF